MTILFSSRPLNFRQNEHRPMAPSVGYRDIISAMTMFMDCSWMRHYSCDGGDIVHVMEETLFMCWRRHCSCHGGDIVHVMDEILFM